MNDAAGHALYVNQQGHIQRELIVNGEMLGRYGDLVDGKNPTTAAGLPNYVNSADFNFSYQPISGNYPSASAGVYAVVAVVATIYTAGALSGVAGGFLANNHPLNLWGCWWLRLLAWPGLGRLCCLGIPLGLVIQRQEPDRPFGRRWR